NYLEDSSFVEEKVYVVLTNGIVWMLIKSSFEEENKLHARVVWKTNIENGELSKVVRKINTISKANIEPFPGNNNQILNEIWQSLLDKPEEIVMSLSLVVESIISQKYSNRQFKNSEIEGFLKEKIKEINLGQFDKENEVPPDVPVRKYLLPPDGTMCQFSYKSSQYNGIIEDGQLHIDKFGKFDSFSGASGKITKTSLNGWLYWKIKLPGDNSQWQFANIWRDMVKK
ncbi:MAG: putative type restriction endonuclease, partial [Euryarchaeota archaeon]|nr:putative type restriction endonuclease [Euryarchaeota archaeon]